MSEYKKLEVTVQYTIFPGNSYLERDGTTSYGKPRYYCDFALGYQPIEVLGCPLGRSSTSFARAKADLITRVRVESHVILVILNTPDQGIKDER